MSRTHASRVNDATGYGFAVESVVVLNHRSLTRLRYLMRKPCDGEPADLGAKKRGANLIRFRLDRVDG